MDYQGAAFCDSLPKGRASGTISIEGKQLIFSFGEPTQTCTITPTTIEMGGAADRLLFFKDPALPDWQIYTSDWKILQDPNLKYHPAVKKIYNQKKKARIKTSLWLMVTLLVLSLIGAGIWYTITDLADYAASKVPRSWEHDAGEQLFPLVMKGKTEIEDEALLSQLQQLVSPLLGAVDDKELEFSFHIIDDSSINAFAMPGGYVVIHSGLLLKAGSSDEVLGVLAHELAHVIKRHHTRSILKNAGVLLTIQLILGDVSVLSGGLADWSILLTQMKTSRNFEFEADETGWNLLLKAKINPRGMIDFFELLNKELGEMKALEEALSIFSTHPATEDRMKALENLWKGCKNKNEFISTEFDFSTFQNQLKERLFSKSE